MSLAEWILKLAGEIGTSNKKILKIRESGYHDKLIKIIKTHRHLRTPEQLEDFRLLIRQAGRDICDKACDTMFTTTTKCWSRGIARKFTKKAFATVTDEAGSAVPSEGFIPWYGKKVNILAGDPLQLPPACL